MSMQVYDSSDLGGRFMSFYRLSALDELPLTLILDPITGAKQRQLTGFIEPQRCRRRSSSTCCVILAFVIVCPRLCFRLSCC